MSPEEVLRAEATKLRIEQRTSLFRKLCQREGIPQPLMEYYFAKPERAWRFDFAWPEYRVALECEGGVWVKGRHTRGKGFIEDCAKYNKGTLLGWRIFRVPSSQLETMATVHMIKQALAL